jgi:hypothetical protein
MAKPIKVTKMTVISRPIRKLLEIKILENFNKGKRDRKRMETEAMINNPPPTGVPDFWR